MLKKSQKIICLLIICSAAALISGFSFAADTKTDDKQTSKSISQERYEIYYFFTNKRCVSCLKLEQFTRDSVNNGFAKEIQSGKVIFKAINTDEKENSHYLEDYKLLSKSVVVAEFKGDKQTRWKNLDAVWDYLSDKKGFEKYIVREVKNFIKENQEK